MSPSVLTKRKKLKVTGPREMSNACKKKETGQMTSNAQVRRSTRRGGSMFVAFDVMYIFCT